jgi:poly(3-hydroxybutyrate) depolymerase
MWSKLTFLLVLLGLVSLQLAEARSAGCGKTPPSSGVKQMTVNGKNRQYTLQVPANYNSNTAYKLIFGYHWLDGNMGTVVSGGYYGLLPLSGGTAIFVAPDGLNRGWANNGGEDITFTDQILKTIQDTLCVDESNIFATGWSYGGSMSFSAACSRPNVFKAIAVIAGAQLSGCAGGTTGIPYLGIHGAADNVLGINMGRQIRDKFLGLNGCQNKNAQEPGSGASNHIRTDYSCRAGYPVTWIAHGGGHVPDPKDGGQGQSWAPGETWKFFTQSGLKGDTGSEPPPVSSTTGGSVPQPTSSSAPPPQPTGACASQWGQCGGQGWTGPTCCQAGSTCKFSNDWYSQCV